MWKTFTDVIGQIAPSPKFLFQKLLQQSKSPKIWFGKVLIGQGIDDFHKKAFGLGGRDRSNQLLPPSFWQG